jgi:YVTN family beta-propeller protein
MIVATVMSSIVMPVSARNDLLYVLNGAGTSVSVINMGSNKLVQEIEGIEAPRGADFSPDGSKFYVTGEHTPILYVVDQKTGKIINQLSLSGNGDGVAATKDGRILVCAGQMLDIFDAATLKKTKTLQAVTGRGKTLHYVQLSKDEKYAIVSSEAGQFLKALDLKTEEFMWEVDFDFKVATFAIESNQDGSPRRIFNTMQRAKAVGITDFATHQKVGDIPMPSEPGGYMSGTSDFHGITVSPDGKTLWVNWRRSNGAFIYSLPDLKLLGHADLPDFKIPGRPLLGAVPYWITFSPDGKTAYISHTGQKSVSAIDTKTLKQIALIPVGQVPARMYEVTVD